MLVHDRLLGRRLPRGGVAAPPGACATDQAAEVRNNADALVYQTDKLLRDQGASFTGAERDQVEAALQELKGAPEGSHLAAIRDATERLTTATTPSRHGSTSRPPSRR